MIIGLTGGIGSGKSTVASAFEALGAGFVDADHVAREIVQPGEPALALIIDHFGANFMRPDGTLDRPALRERVFQDPAQRRWLESVTHPRIRERLMARLTDLSRQAPYVLLVSPLLFESGQDALVERTLVVDVPAEIQLSRTLARDGVSEEQIHAILAAQLPREQRLAKADDVIDNSQDQAHMRRQVERLDRYYRDL
ncbi:dephospho-CoA kinase [Halomonas aquamarina]|uniref:Dephospho-CoA kinase n=1 Tax=Vreelandella aquamarina TaxID=77097 RepID=A0ACC5VUW8_9GAMM|nr:dephospho-CoA kinase [Halomonas aquamarina]MBZ5487942.1 dephospho-CoA kinase [Halomonas aquamarina]